ncbi:MAG: hypothetical protein ACFCVB_06135 [Nodosilinea sp.]
MTKSAAENMGLTVGDEAYAAYPTKLRCTSPCRDSLWMAYS